MEKKFHVRVTVSPGCLENFVNLEKCQEDEEKWKCVLKLEAKMRKMSELIWGSVFVSSKFFFTSVPSLEFAFTVNI